VLCVDHAGSLWIKHVENAFEIVYFFPRIHLKNFILLAITSIFISVFVAVLNFTSTQLFFHFFLGTLFVVLVDTVVLFLFFLSLGVIVALEFLLVHLN